MRDISDGKLVSQADTAIQRIIRGYQPDKVIVFGSFARGDFHEHSDVDLLIVKDTTDPMLRRMDAVLDLCTGDIAVEAFVYTPTELDAMLRCGNDFLERALTDGKVVYERSESK
jgi:predicted nucleotidyltransferase